MSAHSSTTIDSIPFWKQQFASDNCAPATPEVMAALSEANKGYRLSYGDDAITRDAQQKVSDLFSPLQPTVGFVFNGTAANCLALRAMCRPYHAILCHQSSHLETDECGAPAFFTGGSKLVKIPGANAKLTPESIREAAHRRDDIHFPKVRALSLTLSTEWGTLYSLDELSEIGQCAKSLDLRVHLDGARFANAVAALGVDPVEIIKAAQADILSFGGTKNGLTLTEAVVFFNKELSEDFDYLRKQSAQLASKMRVLAAPWLAAMADNQWLKRAHHANEMAQRLAAGIDQIPGIERTFPSEANAVFFTYPKAAYEWLESEGWHFYEFIELNAWRAMCNWSTTPEQVDAFIAALSEGLKHGK